MKSQCPQKAYVNSVGSDQTENVQASLSHCWQHVEQKFLPSGQNNDGLFTSRCSGELSCLMTAVIVLSFWMLAMFVHFGIWDWNIGMHQEKH